MKKLWLLLILALISATVLVGCKGENDSETGNKGENSGENSGEGGANNNNDKEQAKEEIPSFKELLEINDTQKIFETKSNIHADIKVESDNPDYQYTAETIYFDCGDKTDFHEKTVYDSGEIAYISSVGSGVFYSNPTLSMVGIEIGAQFFEDTTLKYDSTPIGNGYIENGYIVYHSYDILEGYADFSGVGYLNTLYFNKDTKLLEKYVSVMYGEHYAVECTTTVTVSYDVPDAMSKFGTTAYDIINNAENLIDVELIEGFNTPEQTSYSLKAPAEAELFIYINDEFYSVYTDAECTNEIFTLADFAGEEKVTLYTAPYEYPEEEEPGDEGEGDADTEAIPSFEELLEINDLQKLFETKFNIHAYITTESDDPDYQYTAELIYFDGGDRTNFHEKTVYDSGETTYMSSVNNGIFYANSELTMVGIEIGKQFYFDSTLDYDSTPIGKGYIENGYIVYHSYNILEGDAEYDYSGAGYLNTLYFNKDTKLLEKYESVIYSEYYVAKCAYTVTVSYDVADAVSKFGTTAYDIINNAEDLIDVELIVGYNTPEQTSYSFKAPAESELFIYIDEEFYSVYTDAECTNEILTLEEFAGEEKVTVYAAPYVYSEEEVRYTVTAEEWEALTEQRNYTVDVWDYEFGEFSHRYTDGVLDIDGDIILFIEDRQYNLEETENGIVAYDCTYMEFTNPGLLSGLNYEDFFFDEELLAYVNKDYEEAGIKMIIRFENGAPVSSRTVNTEDENEVITEKMYTNVGTTVITVPEFTFYYDLDPDPAKLVTEEQWNLYVNEKNYAATLYMFDISGYYEHELISDGDAFMLDETIIVSESGKLYALVEEGDVFSALEYDGIPLPECLIPEDFDFSDFEYDLQYEMYIMKDADAIYYFGFDNGVLTYIGIDKSPDPETGEYAESIGLWISEIGNADIDVPDYVKTTIESRNS